MAYRVSHRGCGEQRSHAYFRRGKIRQGCVHNGAHGPAADRAASSGTQTVAQAYRNLRVLCNASMLSYSCDPEVHRNVRGGIRTSHGSIRRQSVFISDTVREEDGRHLRTAEAATLFSSTAARP